MIDLDTLVQHYPPYLQGFRQHILREYLQYKLLETIFQHIPESKLVFIGGTALSLLYGNRRFSEDLDFDNRDMTQQQFQNMANHIEKTLTLQGHHVAVSVSVRNAFRCKVRFQETLFRYKLSPHQQAILLIQLNTQEQTFSYAPERKLLQKFDVFTEVFAPPKDILLSQKLYALLNRKTPKGRDIYDIIFLRGATTPNFDYLQQKLGIEREHDLRARLLDFCAQHSLPQLAHDVEPFLFSPTEKRKIELFASYVNEFF